MASTAGQPDHERPPSIVHGPATPVPLNMTFGELLDYHVEFRGDQPAVISHSQEMTISWRQLSERSIKMARALAEDGVGKGALVAISLGSRIEYFETFFACARLGAALVMLNYAYAEPEMLALLKLVCQCISKPYETTTSSLLTGIKRSKDLHCIAGFRILRQYESTAKDSRRDIFHHKVRDNGRYRTQTRPIDATATFCGL